MQKVNLLINYALIFILVSLNIAPSLASDDDYQEKVVGNTASSARQKNDNIEKDSETELSQKELADNEQDENVLELTKSILKTDKRLPLISLITKLSQGDSSSEIDSDNSLPEFTALIAKLLANESATADQLETGFMYLMTEPNCSIPSKKIIQISQIFLKRVKVAQREKEQYEQRILILEEELAKSKLLLQQAEEKIVSKTINIKTKPS